MKSSKRDSGVMMSENSNNNCSGELRSVKTSASESPVIAWLEKKLQCVVCSNVMTDPILLETCRHCLCYSCVATLRKTSRNGQPGVTCSVCESFAEEEKDVRESSFLDDLKKIHDLIRAKPKVCKMCDEPTPATHHCSDCQSHLCSNCLYKVHNRLFSKQKHDVIELQQLSGKERTLHDFDKFLTCRPHSGKPIASMCYDCKALVCVECAATSHRDHDLLTPEEATSVMRKKNEGIVRRIDELQQQLRESMSGTGAQSGSSKQEQTIRARAEDLRERVVNDAMVALQQFNNENHLQAITLAHAQGTCSEIIAFKNDVMQEVIEAGAHGDSLVAVCDVQQHLNPRLIRLLQRMQETVDDAEKALQSDVTSQSTEKVRFSFPNVVPGNMVAMPVRYEENSNLWPFSFTNLERPLSLQNEIVLASDCDGFIKSETYALSRNEAWVPSQNAGIMSLFCRPLTKDHRQIPHWIVLDKQIGAIQAVLVTQTSPSAFRWPEVPNKTGLPTVFGPACDTGSELAVAGNGGLMIYDVIANTHYYVSRLVISDICLFKGDLYALSETLALVLVFRRRESDDRWELVCERKLGFHNSRSAFKPQTLAILPDGSLLTKAADNALFKHERVPATPTSSSFTQAQRRYVWKQPEFVTSCEADPCACDGSGRILLCDPDNLCLIVIDTRHGVNAAQRTVSVHFKPIDAVAHDATSFWVLGLDSRIRRFHFDADNQDTDVDDQ